MMKSLWTVLVIVSSLSLPVAKADLDRAQKGHPDFTGSWLPDNKKSDSTGNQLEDNEILIIEHKDPEIKISHHRDVGSLPVTTYVILYTDKRGETNRAFIDRAMEDVKSKTEWKGEKLLRRYAMRKTVRGNVVNVEVFEEMKLADNGNTLVQTFRYVIPRSGTNVNAAPLAPLEIKRVYNRAP